MSVSLNVITPQGLEPLQFPTKFRSPSGSVFDRYDIVNEADLRDAIAKLGHAAGAEKGQVGRSGVVRAIGSPV